ncbi:MAG: Uma2 family endonuclease [Longimicrobiales bacterium]
MESRLQSGWPLTVEEFEQLPEDGDYRTELLRGKLVCEPKPAYGHGRLQSRIAGLFERHIEENALELECVTEVDFRLTRAGSNVCAPDVALIRRARIEADPPSTSVQGAPDMAVEIVSPSNSAADLQAKIVDYFAAGTSLVWVVYRDTRTVGVFRSAAEARYLTGHAELDGADLIPGLHVPVAALFVRL